MLDARQRPDRRLSILRWFRTKTSPPAPAEPPQITPDSINDHELRRPPPLASRLSFLRSTTIGRSASKHASSMPAPAYYSRPLPPIPPQDAHPSRPPILPNDSRDSMPAYTQSDIGHGLATEPRTLSDFDHSPIGASIVPRRSSRKLRKARPQPSLGEDPHHRPKGASLPPVSFRPVQPDLPLHIPPAPTTTPKPIFAMHITRPNSYSGPSFATHSRTSSWASSEHSPFTTSPGRQPLRPGSVVGLDVPLLDTGSSSSGPASCLSSSTGVTTLSSASAPPPGRPQPYSFLSGPPTPESPSSPRARKLTKRRPQPRTTASDPAVLASSSSTPDLQRPFGMLNLRKPQYASRSTEVLSGSSTPPNTRRWTSQSEIGHGSSSAPLIAPYPYSASATGHGDTDSDLDHNYTRSDYGHGLTSPAASATSLTRWLASGSSSALAALCEEPEMGHEASSVVAARISMIHSNERGGSDRETSFVHDPRWTIGEEGEDDVEQDGIQREFDPYAELRYSPLAVQAVPLLTPSEESTPQTSTEGSLITPTRDLPPMTFAASALPSAARAAPSSSSGSSRTAQQLRTPPATVRRRTVDPEKEMYRRDPLRRWTVAMADEDDEIVAEEWDQMRRVAKGRKSGRASPAILSDQEVHGEGEVSSLRLRTSLVSLDALGGLLSGDMVYGGPRSAVLSAEDLEGGEEEEEDEDGWQSARRALFCCKELVRTERAYQAKLMQLIEGETTSTPPPLMHTYLPALLRGSQLLLDALAEDPSAWGVSTAFVGLEDELEHAFVAWCGIVGEFFIDRPRPRKIVKSPKTPPASMSRASRRVRSGTDASGWGEGEVESPVPMRPTPVDGDARKSMGAMSMLSYAESNYSGFSNPGTPTPSEHTFGHGRGKGAKEHARPSVRELAIQPVQRVMRYVLQYRDLLNHTPATASARSVVEHALEVATRIAHKCDQAQKNSAFLLRRS